MTSAGTDVIEMSTSTARFTTVASVDVVADRVSAEVGIVERAVEASVVGASVEGTEGAVETGAADEVGAATGTVALEAHAEVRSAKTTTQRGPEARRLSTDP